mmetsp:Transcript_21740/g.44641  ORF Transcript_21740/g.44641 Transcript_21740/m.44641 type:complete len:97 (+) Transcript_21740:2274-2564(+)
MTAEEGSGDGAGVGGRSVGECWGAEVGAGTGLDVGEVEGAGTAVVVGEVDGVLVGGWVVAGTAEVGAVVCWPGVVGAFVTAVVAAWGEAVGCAVGL